MSAGSIGTPHILLNSGIGDEGELKAVGVPPIVHLPSVGKNLSDQPSIFTTWFANSTNTKDKLVNLDRPRIMFNLRQSFSIKNNATLLGQLLDQWMATRTGPLVDPPANQVAWLRIPGNSSIFSQFPDPSAGLNTPHYELVLNVSISPLMSTVG